MNGFVGDLRAIDAAQRASMIERLNAEIAAIQRTRDVQVRVDETGFEVMGGSPAEATAYLKLEIIKWGKIIKETGVTPN